MPCHEDLTPAAEDYLKVVWSAQEWSDTPVTTKLLAERLGLGPSTVSEMVGRLRGQGLIDHARYGTIALTPDGARHAVAVIRRHRLLETFLVEMLDYSWDEVHDEAEVLEHAVSDRMVERIDAALGHPVRDPHGDVIPTPDGDLDQPAARTLAELETGAAGVVTRISDADPDLLRYFAELGLGLDTRVEVVDRRDYAGVLRVRWSPPAEGPRGETGAGPVQEVEIDLGLPAARAVWVNGGEAVPTAS